MTQQERIKLAQEQLIQQNKAQELQNLIFHHQVWNNPPGTQTRHYIPYANMGDEETPDYSLVTIISITQGPPSIITKNPWWYTWVHPKTKKHVTSHEANFCSTEYLPTALKNWTMGNEKGE